MKPETAQKLLRKVQEDYDRIASEFSATRQYLWDDLKGFSSYVRDGDSVLDLGCGNGRLFSLFEGKAIDYAGMDSCALLIEKARERFKIKDSRLKINDYGPEFMVGDILDIPFAADSFDAVFCIAALPHIPSRALRRRAMAEIFRVLKPGGRLVLTAWNLYQKKYLPCFLDYRAKIKNYKACSPKDIFIPWKLRAGEIVRRYYHAFTGGELRRLAVRSGFKILKLESSRHNFVLAAGK